MDATARFIFEGAIDDNRTAVVSIANGNETKSQLGQFADRNAEGFTFQTSSWPECSSESVGPMALFQFGASGSAVQFEAEVRDVHRQDQMIVVRCANPKEVNLIQRRTHFRMPIPANAPLAVTAWKIPAHWYLSDRPKPSTQLRIEVIDISLGGLCVQILPHRVGPEAIAVGDRLRLEMRYQELEAIFDSMVEHRTDPSIDGSVRAGISFQKLEGSIEGRRASFFLDRVMAALQREAIKETTAA